MLACRCSTAPTASLAKTVLATIVAKASMRKPERRTYAEDEIGRAWLNLCNRASVCRARTTPSTLSTFPTSEEQAPALWHVLVPRLGQ